MSSLTIESGHNNGYYWTIQKDKGNECFKLSIYLECYHILTRYYLSIKSAKQAAKYYTEI